MTRDRPAPLPHLEELYKLQCKSARSAFATNNVAAGNYYVGRADAFCVAIGLFTGETPSQLEARLGSIPSLMRVDTDNPKV